MLRLLFLLLFITQGDLILAQNKSKAGCTEGEIRVSIDILMKQHFIPYAETIMFKFIGRMLIEPLSTIITTEVGGKQKQELIHSGFMIIDTRLSKYYKIPALECGIKTDAVGELKSKSEGMLFNEHMDLFAGRKDISALRDSVVNGKAYKRFGVNTIDPGTRQKVRIIAHTTPGKETLPISLSGTVENKFNCTIDFLDMYYAGYESTPIRKAFKFVPTILSIEERKVLQCFKRS